MALSHCSGGSTCPGSSRNPSEPPNRPEECGDQHALGGSGGPERLHSPPLGIVVGHAEVVPRDWVGEVVVDDAVGGGVEAGDDGVVVGECERGEDGDQALGGGGAIGEEAAEVREGGLELVPEAEAIRGYEQHHRLLELGERPRGGGDRGHGGVEGRAEDEEEGGGALGRRPHGGLEESSGEGRRVT